MQVPGNMTTPPLKLNDGEQVITHQASLRKKGILGNRYGEIYVTNQRVAFVKAVMKGVGGALKAKGAKPMLEFPLDAIEGASRARIKKLEILDVSTRGKSERFAIGPDAIEVVAQAIEQRQA